MRGRIHERFFWDGLFLFRVWFSALALSPSYRGDWLLENGLTALCVLVLIGTRRVLPLSRISYTLIFLFLAVHVLGSHYTYLLVPYESWLKAGFGFSPAREMFYRVADVRGFWGYFLPLDLVMSSSLTYELIEWLAATVFGGELGMAFLGTQGDIWDAHKDMALAALGASLAILITLALNVYLQRDFAREWGESLKMKHQSPLGEDEICRLWRRRQR